VLLLNLMHAPLPLGAPSVVIRAAVIDGVSPASVQTWLLATSKMYSTMSGIDFS
jgi:hypothetical protein